MPAVEHVELSDGARLWTASSRSPGSDIAVVLVHGGPGLWDYLAPVAAMVDDLATTHRFDQRGCGRSSGEDGYTMQQLVVDLEGIAASAAAEGSSVTANGSSFSSCSARSS